MAADEIDALASANDKVHYIPLRSQPPLLLSAASARKWAGTRRNVTLAWRLRARESGEVLAYASSAEVIAEVLGIEKHVVFLLRDEPEAFTHEQAKRWVHVLPEIIGKDEVQFVAKINF